MSSETPIDIPAPNAGLQVEPNQQQLAFQHMLEPSQKAWERSWVWVTERMNPIVVKEIRQSLKSRNFAVSFGLTLIVAVAWTIASISILMPRILYLPGGVPLLYGFMGILTIPLMVLIPAGAFLSLSVEKQDSTFDLLSISSLSAIQIVYGKMASAMVQMVLYISALAPCIVLTYLMRGVSLSQILMLIILTIIISIAETALALLLAAIAKTSLLQAFVGIMMLAALIFGAFLWVAFTINASEIFGTMPLEAYSVLMASMTCVAFAIALALRAAAAAIDFPSENHSTPLRLRIFGLVALVFFWILVAVAASQSLEPLGIILIWIFGFLMFVGSLINGELGVMSPRAQRGLPRTFLGRVNLTWLFPGTGLGYVYLVCLFGAVVATSCAVEFYFMWNQSLARVTDSHSVMACLLLGYFITYLGLNRLTMMLIPKSMQNRMLTSFAILAVMLIAFQAGPWVLAYYLNDYRNYAYDWHQAFNIVWTLEELDNYGISASNIQLSAVILTLTSIGVLGLNLLLCTRDVLMVRVSEPPRVKEDKVSSKTEDEAPRPDPFAID